MRRLPTHKWVPTPSRSDQKTYQFPGFCRSQDVPNLVTEKDNLPNKKIVIDIILDSSFDFQRKKTQEPNIHNLKDLYNSLYNTILNILSYNQLTNIDYICRNNDIQIKLYENNGINVDFIDFNQGNKLWNFGFNLEHTNIKTIC